MRYKLLRVRRIVEIAVYSVEGDEPEDAVVADGVLESTLCVRDRSTQCSGLVEESAGPDALDAAIRGLAAQIH